MAGARVSEETEREGCTRIAGWGQGQGPPSRGARAESRGARGLATAGVGRRVPSRHLRKFHGPAPGRAARRRHPRETGPPPMALACSLREPKPWRRLSARSDRGLWERKARTVTLNFGRGAGRDRPSRPLGTSGRLAPCTCDDCPIDVRAPWHRGA